MRQREEMAFVIAAEPHALDRLRPVAVGGEHLLALEDELDRPTDDAGGHRGERDMRPGIALAAKPAADKRTDRTHLLGLEAEQFGERIARVRDALGCAVDGQALAVV